MKLTLALRGTYILALAALLTSTVFAEPIAMADSKLYGTEKIQTPIGIINLIDTYFDNDASKRLFDEMDYQRAAQAYIWSMPLVSSAIWRDRQNKAFGVKNPTDFVVLDTVKQKSGILTPNLTTPYIFNFSTLKSGPIQIDYPAGETAGGVLDFWQRPVVDLGLTGPDKGKGATYIVVGPEDDPSKYKKDGVYVVQSATNNILVALRLLSQDADYYGKFTSEYRMGSVGKELKPSHFIKNKDVKWLATPPRDIEYWQTLSDIIQDEPVREIDKGWMAMVAPLGIVKGKSFQPDDRLKKILLNGMKMGVSMAIYFDPLLANKIDPPLSPIRAFFVLNGSSLLPA
ncbi:DUF1254 domain-containing protein [Castellaniella sp.]|uniref:DUF1254 domain-containing protein n=1 Tax=Castellaniella sp. TaxID=1955812 RepID=UPI002AFFDB22|nr:DUF1254 domain-containing protein [Castellaniella sp.]